MPELPEVENTRRWIAPAWNGTTIHQAKVLHPRTARRASSPLQIERRLRQATVQRTTRKGKFLLLELSNGMTWVIHLGMSGRINLAEQGQPDEKHLRFRARTKQGQELRLVDTRTFGFVMVYKPEELASSSLAQLGPDAYDELPTTAKLVEAFSDRKAVIKNLLLDQRIIAGLGNIYTDEILFRSRISPHRPGGSLSSDEVAGIRKAVRPILKAAIEHGGTSLADLAYLLPDGRAGRFLSRLKVYGRIDRPCLRCKTAVMRSVIANRSAHWCPQCQPLKI